MTEATALSALKGSRCVVLGGGGFLGSHLCDRILAEGGRVVIVDNYVTGSRGNVAHLQGDDRVEFVDLDITNFIDIPGDVDYILHFASPASPIDYLKLPIQTLKVGSLGTHNALGLARVKKARVLLASTSEVYGDPLVNPQPETYWGNVNPIGPRGVYDEAKRFAEAITLAYHRVHDVEVRVARIFNSVLADEQLLYDDGHELRRETAQELAERLQGAVDLDGYRVPSFDADQRVQAAEATAFIGHPTRSRCYEVRTRYGRSIRVTGDHSLFVEGPDGRAVPRMVNELSIGDRIAVAGRIRVPERDRRQVDLLDVWQTGLHDDWDLSVHQEGLGAQVWEQRDVAVDVVVRRRSDAFDPDTQPPAHLRQSSWGTVVRWRDFDSAPLAVLKKLGIEVRADAMLRGSRSKRALPRLMPIEDDLLWFLGLYVAEGSWHRSDHDAFITLSCGLEELDRAAAIVRDLGLHPVRAPAGASERSAQLVVHSRLLLDVLEHVGFDGGDKRIPGWILGLPLARLKWFIEGYREGDGVHSGQKLAESKRHEFSTVSESLKDDLVVAFGRFGLVPSVGRYETTFRQRTGDRRYPFWRLTLPHVRPWSPLEWDGGVEQTLQSRRSGDLVWAVVRSIEEVEATPLVYDFCVPGQENFYAGTGVMAHNTYGPRMRTDDGRAVPAFFTAALRNEPVPIHGDGSQTRSLCYVDDEIEGLLRLMVSDHTGPVNIGNAHEITIRELAETIQEVVGSDAGIKETTRPVDDPNVRRPDTTKARELLGWEAKIGLRDGLERTLTWFSRNVEH